MATAAEAPIYREALSRIGEEWDKNHTYSPLLWQWLRHLLEVEIKGSLVVQVMPKETGFHMSGDWMPHTVQRALTPLLFAQRKISCFTWKPFKGSLIVSTPSVTLSELNSPYSGNRGEALLIKNSKCCFQSQEVLLYCDSLLPQFSLLQHKYEPKILGSQPN